MADWFEVTKKNPCPICGHDSWCRIAKDGNAVCCQRGNGGGIERYDKNGVPFWLYFLNEGQNNQINLDSLPPIPSSTTTPRNNRADPDTLHEVYSTMLGDPAVSLSEEHKENLRQRGLPDEEIVRREYRSLPIRGRSPLAKRLIGRFGVDKISHIPGFGIKEGRNGKSYWTMGGAAGLMIPVRDTQGHIVGIKIRANETTEDGRKYSWLSLGRQMSGGAGQVNLPHVPIYNGDKSVIRITEGELKADIATVLSGILTISFPGVGSWRLVLPIIKEYQPKKVLVAFDNDSRTNRMVVTHMLNCITELLKSDNGLNLNEVGIEIWDTAYKGIDDALAAGKNIQIITGEAALSIVQTFYESAIALNPVPEKKLTSFVSDGLGGLGEDCPEEFKEHKRPPHWNIDLKDGVWRESDRDGYVCACPTPVGITRRLIDIDTQMEKTEIAFLRDGYWRRLVCNTSQLFHNQKCIEYSDKGLPVSSSTSKEFVNYLTLYQNTNLDLIKSVPSISRMGWVNENTFVPFAAPNIVIDAGENNYSEYHAQGSYEGWKQMILMLREKYPLVRLVIAAAFTAPLLKILGQRTFLVHIWGPTRGGKTATVNAGLSAFGRPGGLLLNFNSTKVALERTAGFFNDLPLGIDERQAAGDRQEFIESLVYMLGLGKGRARGSKSGGLQHVATWRTVALTNGEQPLSSDSSMGGINTRVLEIYGIPIPDEKLASKLHTFFERHYGHAGPVFIKRLIETRRDYLINFYNNLLDKLNAAYPEKLGSHISALTSIAIADFLVSRWIFDISEEQALQEAKQLIEITFEELDNTADIDDAVRAYEYIESFFLQNMDRFKDNAFAETYGFHKQGVIYFYPNVFKRALKEGGFNPNRIIRDWKASGRLIIQRRGNENFIRNTVRVTDPYRHIRTEFYAVKCDAIQYVKNEDQEDIYKMDFDINLHDYPEEVY